MIRTFRINSHLVRIPESWTEFTFHGKKYFRRNLADGDSYWVSADGKSWSEGRRQGEWVLRERGDSGLPHA